MDSALLVHRLHFAFTVTFHYLFPQLRVGTNNGILDWYTVLTGVIALVTLTTHGSLYIATKTEDDLNRRARTVAMWVWPLQLVFTAVGLIATISIRRCARQLQAPHDRIPDSGDRVRIARRDDAQYSEVQGQGAFVSSAVYIVGMLVGAAFALYPIVLPASTDPALNLTIYNTAAGHHGLSVGFTWWILGALLALGYFSFLFRMFKGKVRLEGEGY